MQLIALGQSYFAIQTRKQELLEQRYVDTFFIFVFGL